MPNWLGYIHWMLGSVVLCSVGAMYPGYVSIACQQLKQLGKICSNSSTFQRICSKSVDRKEYQLQEINGIAFYLKPHHTKLNWNDAFSTCRAEGGSLVTVESLQKKAIVDRHVPLIGKLWLGLRDVFKNNTWYWPDGNPATYSNWHKGEPANMWKGKPEDCATASRRHYSHLGWDDIYCSRKILFLCEIVF